VGSFKDFDGRVKIITGAVLVHLVWFEN